MADGKKKRPGHQFAFSFQSQLLECLFGKQFFVAESCGPA